MNPSSLDPRLLELISHSPIARAVFDRGSRAGWSNEKFAAELALLLACQLDQVLLAYRNQIWEAPKFRQEYLGTWRRPEDEGVDL